MDPLAFAQKVSTQNAGRHLDSWARRYIETSALQTLRAAQFLETADADTRNEYIRVLESVLQKLPEDYQLEVSSDLFDTLLSLSDDAGLQTLIETKVGQPTLALQ